MQSLESVCAMLGQTRTLTYPNLEPLTLKCVPGLAALADRDDAAVSLGNVLDAKLGRVLRREETHPNNKKNETGKSERREKEGDKQLQQFNAFFG